MIGRAALAAPRHRIPASHLGPWLHQILRAAGISDVGLTGATVAPGASATIPVTFAPSGRRGSIDAVDDIDPNSVAINEVGALPYAYRVGRHHRRW